MRPPYNPRRSRWAARLNRRLAQELRPTTVTRTQARTLEALRALSDLSTTPPPPRAPGTPDRARNACAPPEGGAGPEELEQAP